MTAKQVQHFLLQTITQMVACRGGDWFGRRRLRPALLPGGHPDVTPVAWNAMLRRLRKVRART